jgi:small subunit ribosomal protein S17
MKDRGIRKKMIGVVITDTRDKTAVVQVTRLKRHKMYKKTMRSNTKYLVHDPKNSCQIGDKVRIIESRPISKLKRWRILEILDMSGRDRIKNETDDSMELAK